MVGQGGRQGPSSIHRVCLRPKAFRSAPGGPNQVFRPGAPGRRFLPKLAGKRVQGSVRITEGSMLRADTAGGLVMTLRRRARPVSQQARTGTAWGGCRDHLIGQAEKIAHLLQLARDPLNKPIHTVDTTIFSPRLSSRQGIRSAVSNVVPRVYRRST